MKMQTARDRAEELWLNLQGKARTFLEAEEGLVATVRELLEAKVSSSTELRAQLDELLGKIRAHKVWEKVSKSSTVIALSDYREGVEHKVEEVTGRIIGSLQIASTSEVEELQKQLKSINRKVNELNRKLKSLDG